MFITKYCDIMSSMKKLLTTLLSFTLIFTMAFSTAGCAENADVLKTDEPSLDYATVCQSFQDYRDNYSKYREENTDDISKLSNGYTTDEIPCSVYYVEADNNKYKMATLEASRVIDGNELTVTDSYFSIADNEMIVVRSYVDGQGAYKSIEYVVYDGVLYLIDNDNSELTRESKSDSFDFYLAFDEITSLYGES